MADRNFIIDIAIKARDETARAFASAVGNMEAYDKILDEQTKKSDRQVRVNQDLAKSHEDVAKAQKAVHRGNQDIITAQAEYEKSVQRVTKAESEMRSGNIQSAVKVRDARLSLKQATEDLAASIRKAGNEDRNFNTRASQAASRRFQESVKNREVYAQQSKLLSELAAKSRQLAQASDPARAVQLQSAIRGIGEGMRNLGADSREVDSALKDVFDVAKIQRSSQAMQQYRKLLDDVANAERRRDVATGKASGRDREVIHERLEVDVGLARARLDEFRLSERAHGIDIPVELREKDIARAREEIDALKGTSGKGGPLGDLQKAFADLDTSTQGFSSSIRNAFGFTLVALIQPVSVALLGMVGAFAALASAAVAAGAAIGTTFLSAMVQGIPVLGLFAAAMQRMTTILGYVQAQYAQRQQQFLAQFQNQAQLAMGINQVAIAEHNLSNTLYAQQQAIRNVSVAQLGLLQARQQAVRQLQDLIFAEQSAKLAAEGAAQSVLQAQKALQQAIAQGGDVASAQLQLSQAQLSHRQAVTQAGRAAQDAAPNSVARREIQQTLVQAQQASEQAKRAVTDSIFAVQQARAAIIQAQQAAAGYSVAAAAQLAWLRSQMTATERSLADNITKIYGLFQGVNGRLRPVTDAILGAFIPLTQKIYDLFNNPRMFAALLNLGNQMGNAIRTVTNTLFSSRAIEGFINIVNAAAANMRPLANIVSHMLIGIGSIVQTAIPFVHQFLGYLDQLTGKFASWASSVAGRNWLSQFFKVAFASLEAFMNLGVAFARFFGAVISTGGGAKTGIGLIQTLTDHINRATDSINKHGSAWKTLQTLWASAKTTMQALGIILGALARGFMAMGGTPQGRAALLALANLIARVLVPAFVQAFVWIGKATGAVLIFLQHHPKLAAMLKDIIAAALVMSVVHKGVGLIFGPLSGIIKILGPIAGLAKTVGPALLEAFGNPIVAAIVAVIAVIVILAAKTGNLHNLFKTVSAPFIAAWKLLKPALEELWKGIVQVGNAFGAHLGKNSHKDVADFLNILKTILVALARAGIAPLVIGFRILGTILQTVAPFIKSIVNVFKDLARIIGDVIHGRLDKLPHDFLKLGKDIVTGLWNGLKLIPTLLVKLFIKMVETVLSFLGISSPSKKMHNIGSDIVNGLWNGLKAIAGFGGKIIGWIGEGIGKVFSWLFNRGKDIIKWILHGAQSVAHMIISIGSSILTWIWDGIKTIAKDIFNVGKWIVQHIADGIKSAGKILPNALKSILPGGSGGVLGKLIGSPLSIFQQGGPVPGGYGGGDIVGARLEPGEHVLTKEEVRAAGGHGAIYAIRNALGGGGRGGPRQFAQGGQVDPLDAAFGITKPVARNVQGVIGYPGGDLQNILNFQKAFAADWKDMWDNIQKLTKDNIQTQDDQWNTLLKNIDNVWKQINDNTSKQMNTLLDNFRWVLNKVDTDIFNAFWYINHAANASLQAFGAKPVSVDLGGLPKFAGGGFMGKAGERGKDAVLTLLGKGEAVLNWAHQKIVEPALNAYYGFGLNEMFGRTDTTHAGTRDEARGYAGGGYIYPFPNGTSISRVDMGVDANMPVGAPIGPIGSAKVMGVLSNWYQGQPLIYWQLTDGPRAGQYAYVAEQITNLAPVGATLAPNQAVATYAGSGTGIEYGWAAPGGQTLAQATTGYSEGQVTPAGQNMMAFLQGLSHGKIVGGGGLAQAIKHVADITVKGSGTLKDLTQAAIEKVRGAANAFIDKQAAAMMPSGAGGTVASGLPPGPGQIVGASEFGPPGVDPGVHDASGAYGTNFPGSIARLESDPQLWSQLPPHSRVKLTAPTGKSLVATVIDFGSGGGPVQGYPRGIDLWYQTAQLMGLPADGSWAGLLKVARAARGAFGQVRRTAETTTKKAVPIIAHAGEWVLNEEQQKILAAKMGTTVRAVKSMLGFKGGPQSFDGGGEIQEFAGGGEVIGNKFIGSLYGWPGVNTTTGAFVAPQNTFSIFSYLNATIQIYERAQNIVLKNIEHNGKNLTNGMKTFLANLTKITGDNGIIALAAQALDQFITQQTTATQLAANGVRILRGYTNQRLAFGRAQTALAAAQTQLAASVSEGGQLRQLQQQEVQALHQVIQQIHALGPPTKKNEKVYQQLQAARQNLINQIQEADAKVAQNLEDQYNNQVAAFQAQLDQAMRGTATLTGEQFRAALNNNGGLQAMLAKVGPAIGAGLAQMAQGIAQALGDPRKLAESNQAILQTATAQRDALQKAYTDAANRAKTDPRWQKVADDLLSQLEGATQSVVQAQVQALQDAISAVDTRGQMTQSYLDMFNRLQVVRGAMGDQRGMIAQQIGASRFNTGFLTNQLQSYQGLYNQAAAQGNVGAMNDLTAKIQDLTAQIAEANLQTQQLIVAYRQVAVTIQQAVTSASSGFFQAATSIAQTLGAITGSQNLPALISYARQAGAELVQEGRTAVQNIIDTISDPSGPFGASTGTANSLLGQLVAGFNQGPQGFANVLAALAPQLSNFEANLPQEQQQLFQSLVQALIDNTTAQVENTQQIQQLNATSNQQAFTSSAWQLFRQAVFTGLGGLLPQYAMMVPGALGTNQIAGSAPIMAPTSSAPGATATAGGSKGAWGDNHFYITNPTEVADPVALGNSIAWRINHDPNSR